WNFLGGQLTKGETQAALAVGLLNQKEKSRGTYDRFRDRVLFPIHDLSGRVCGFGGRIIGEGQPKYMNSPESPVYNKSRLLLGLYQAKEPIRQREQAILVEGNFDLVSLAVHGIDNVVAPLGTAVTREQIRLLKKFAEEGVLLFDGDQAGIKAAVRAAPLFLAEQMKGRVALLPKGHDPDTYVREHGAEALKKLVKEGQELSEFILSQLVERHGLSLEGKSRIAEELKPMMQAAASSLQRSVVVAHFADKLNITAEELSRLAGNEKSSREVIQPARRSLAANQAAALSSQQKKLVSFMVLNPDKFARLTEAGLRECLAGSIGEIIFLQMQELLAKSGMIEPEELLNQLPSGAERELVAGFLLNIPLTDDADEDFFHFLRQFKLKKQSDNILQSISKAQSEGNFEQLKKLLSKKQKIDRQMKQAVKP
ncbi:MAG: DNA primase, partial [Deltaproteobacteria bacterium]